MFSKNLSLTILQLCSSRDLSYEKAAELCGLSLRYFDSVARGQTNASIITLEKLCKGLELTPKQTRLSTLVLLLQPSVKPLEYWASKLLRIYSDQLRTAVMQASNSGI